MPIDPPIMYEIKEQFPILGYRATSCLYAFMRRDLDYWLASEYAELRDACLIALAEADPLDDSEFARVFRYTSSREEYIARIAATYEREPLPRLPQTRSIPTQTHDQQGPSIIGA